MKDMAMKSLDLQLKLMVVVFVEIYARENVPIFYEATGMNMQSLAVAV